MFRLCKYTMDWFWTFFSPWLPGIVQYSSKLSGRWKQSKLSLNLAGPSTTSSFKTFTLESCSANFLAPLETSRLFGPWSGPSIFFWSTCWSSHAIGAAFRKQSFSSNFAVWAAWKGHADHCVLTPLFLRLPGSSADHLMLWSPGSLFLWPSSIWIVFVFCSCGMWAFYIHKMSFKLGI